VPPDQPAASVHDSAAGTQLMTKVAALHPTVTKAWADNGYKTEAVERATHLGIDPEIVHAAPPTVASTSSPAAGSSNAPSADP